MRVVIPMGRWMDNYYEDGKVIRSRTGTPSIWGVMLRFAEINSVNNENYFYFVVVKKGEPGKVTELPLKGINGCLLVYEVKHLIYRTLNVIYQVAPFIIEDFSYNVPGVHRIADIVYSPNPLGVGYLRYGLNGGYDFNGKDDLVRPLIGVRTCDGLIEKQSGLKHSEFHEDKVDSINFSYADRIYGTGYHMVKGISQISYKYLSSSERRYLNDSLKYISHGIPSREESSLDYDRGKVIGYFGRFSEADKRTGYCIDIMKKCYSANYVDRIIVTSGNEGDANSPHVKDSKEVEFQVTGMDYLEKAKEARCTIMYLDKISCPLAMLELMSVGVIPIVPKNRVWSKEFFKNEFPDYPFMFENEKEMIAMIKVIMDNDDLYKKWAKKMAVRVNEAYDIVDLKREVMEDMKQEVLERRYGGETYFSSTEEYEKKYRLLKDYKAVAEELGDEFYFKDFLELSRKRGISYIFMGGVKLLTNSHILDYLRKLGYRDTMDSADIYLKKEC